MKRIGFLFDKICDISNIRTAMAKASEGKRNHKYVKRVLNNSDYYAESVRTMLIDGTYNPSPYSVKKIFDGSSGKERNIYKPNFYPDQIIHWALILQIQPVMMKSMYQYNCGSVPGRGTGYGQKVLRRWLDTDKRNTKYCLKMDISKYYPSVNNEILKSMFRRKIKDNKCLWLIDTIIDSAVGLPIGNYTSQWFSNFFLERLDHYIKENLGAVHYIRYVDDLVILGANKRKLHAIRKSISEYLKSIKLSLKGNWQVFRTDKRDIDFLGMRFYRYKTILRKRNSLRIRRRMRKIKRKGYLCYRDACTVISYWGWIKHTNSYKFYHSVVKPTATIKKAKGVISRYARKRNKICASARIQSVDARDQAVTAC